MAKGKIVEWRTPERLLLIQGWARDGLNDKQIAHNIGISRTTLYEWIKTYGDIADALKKGKEVIDLEVENALLKRALGYEVCERRVEESDKNGVKIIETTKHVAPDVSAQVFWLKNRKADKWRDKQEIHAEEEHSGGIVIMPEVVPLEEPEETEEDGE